MGEEKKSRMSAACHRQIVLTFFCALKECFYSCPVNWSFVFVTDLCSTEATSLPDAYCLIHWQHSSPPHTRVLLSTYSLPVRQLDLQQAAWRARRRKQIKYRWIFTWGVSCGYIDTLIALQKEMHLSRWIIDSLLRCSWLLKPFVVTKGHLVVQAIVWLTIIFIMSSTLIVAI